MPQKILIIDDEIQIRRLLRLTLEADGYMVCEAENGILGLQETAVRRPDGIILDLGLPDINGLEVLRSLREWTQTPVLILSVRSEEEDKIKALDTGADDYLTKPFGARELLARLRAILRRVRSDDESVEIQIGDIDINLAARMVSRNNTIVHLTATEYALFRLLVQHRGKVLTYNQILCELWGPNAIENTQHLRVHMAHLRRKLEEKPDSPKHLKTDSGIGYRLVE